MANKLLKKKTSKRVMTVVMAEKKQLEAFKKNIRQFAQDKMTTKNGVRDFLVSTGVYTSDGKLTKNYR